MRRKTTLLGAALALAFSAVTAHASTGVCGMNSVSDVKSLYDDIVGVWVSQTSAGYVSAGGMTMPAGAAPAENIRMWTADGALIGSSTDGDVPYDLPFEPADEPGWQFRSLEAGGKVITPALTDQELEIAVGCSIEDLPKLIAQVDIPVPEGTMQMTLRAIYLGDLGMYGIGEWLANTHGQTVLIRKPFTMTRLP